MSELRIWLLMLGMGVITYALRLSIIVLLERVPLPAAALRGLRYVPAAVFSALVAPALLRPERSLWVSPGNPFLLAGALAAAVAWRTKSMALTIALGMITLWLLG